jgi:hypothetical protein
VYTFGGVGANGSITTAVYEYTISTNTWSQVTTLPNPVRDSAAVLAPNGLIYVIGGTTAAGTTAGVESYNPTTGTWNVETSLPQPISSAAATVDSLGRIEVLGGYDASGNALASVLVSQELAQPDAAPVITSAPVTAAVVNVPYSYQVLTTGNPQPTYTLTSYPAGMMIDPNTGRITWTPTYATEVASPVTVVASSTVGQVSQTFTVGVAPEAPTGLTASGSSTTAITLSWNASPDPNVTGYDIYHRTYYHSPRGSGGGHIDTRIASNVPSTSITLAPGTYLISAVNSAGVESARIGPVSAGALTAPYLYSYAPVGSVNSYLPITVGETVQVQLYATGNEAPTYSLVSGPSGVSVDRNTGLVTYTPAVADIGSVAVTFAATNSVGTSTYTVPFTVVALTPTVTLTAGESVYDGNPHAATATAVDANGNQVGGSFAITYNGDPNPPTEAGTYPVTATFTSTDPSYANAVATGTLTIDPATPTITITSDSVDYDGNPHAAVATVGGVNGITVDGSFAITYNGDPNPPTDPGLYQVAATFTSNDPNYATTTTATANLIITSPGTLVPTLTLTDGSAPYDGTQHADTGTAIGQDGMTQVNGSFVITYNGSTTAPTAAGTYDVVATFVSSDSAYADTTVTGTLTITPATPTLALDATTFVYNALGQGPGATVTGVDGITPVNGTFAITYNGLTTPPVDAGTYDVEVTFTSADPNYVSTTLSSTFTILQATPSVGLLNGEWEFLYNGTPQGVTGSAYGVDGITPVAGTFSYAYSQYYYPYTPLPGTPTDVGTYAVTITFNSTDPNYTDGSFSWEEIIESPFATVTVNPGPFTYTGSQQSATFTATGIDGVPLTATATYVTYNGSTNAPTAAGTYNVYALISVTDPNYATSGYATGTMTITKATPTFSNLSAPAINVGAATVTVTGHIAAGTVAPGGDDVAVTINGVTVPAAVSNNGNFSATFAAAGLATGTYPITFAYLGDAARFTEAGTTGLASSTLTVRAAPVVQTSPLSQTVLSGSTVTFTASASGFPAPTVQWQVSTNGTNYTNISGATSTTYTLTAAASQNGYRYRAVFTNSAGTATTAAATLTVQTPPAVKTNPTSHSVTAGSTVTFTAAATGTPTPTVQWQLSIDGGVTYTDIFGATGTTLTLTGVTTGQNGYRYRAVFTNPVGSVTTTAAVLTVH